MKISIVLAVLAVMVAIQAVPIPDGTCTEKASSGAICGTNPGGSGGSGGDGGDSGDGPSETDPDPDMYEAYSKREVSAVRITEASRNPVMVSYKRAEKNDYEEPEAEANKGDGNEEPETEANKGDGNEKPETETKPEGSAEEQGDKDEDKDEIDEDF
ncbi:hypothetical protein BGZ99_007450 [Dissophora globulifera]|uniref:Secreted protein n=1 Tax=Dissophora globulifera TaxID=979702 RepID=A0A9P6RAQ5_9FUNG|nr:hypothetical protein BGZ99_007450 [Dissophora globulifera]